jgi:hypothetical protein
MHPKASRKLMQLFQELYDHKIFDAWNQQSLELTALHLGSLVSVTEKPIHIG